MKKFRKVLCFVMSVILAVCSVSLLAAAYDETGKKSAAIFVDGIASSDLINAETGEIVWRTDYTCYTVQDLSGGVQGTIAVGKNKLSDMIFVPIARTPGASSGTLVALKKDSGEKVWEKETSMYSWSSPVDFYDADGNGYLLYCNSGFNMFLIDGKTGEQLDYMNLGGNIEASPAMYGNYAVVGTRAMRTYCIQVN